MKLTSILENTKGDQYVITKHPDTEIYDNSTLFVNESEQALFFRDGVIVQRFTSGRHVLSSGNQPGLFSKQKKLLNGKTFTTTTVYFVRTTHLTEIKWGTDTPIMMFDQRFGFSVGVRANGAYTIRIKEPEKLFIKLLGMDTQDLTKQQFAAHFRSVFILHVKDKIARYMRDNKLTIMEMCTEYISVGENIKEALVEKFLEYGVELLDFAINNISIPEDDPCYAKINNAYAENSIVGIQGDNWDRISQKEISMKVAENANKVEYVNVGFNGNMNGMQYGGFVPQGGGYAPQGGYAAPQQAAPAAGETMFCRECGARIPRDSRFCPHCGTRTAN